ncbi:hypothetical protein D3C80_1834040 [compost metagenome]
MRGASAPLVLNASPAAMFSLSSPWSCAKRMTARASSKNFFAVRALIGSYLPSLMILLSGW